MRSIDFDIAYLDGFLKGVEIVAGRRGRMAANWYAANGDPLPGLATFLREREIPFERLTATAVSREEFFGGGVEGDNSTHGWCLGVGAE
jgi:hypothetical protein